jgi:hypothetical protein
MYGTRISLEVMSIVYSKFSLKVVPADVSLIRRYCFHSKTPHNVLLSHYVLVQNLLGSGRRRNIQGAERAQSVYRRATAGRPRGWSSSLCGDRSLLPLHIFKIDSVAHPVSYPICAGGSFLGGKTAGE